MTKVAVVLLLAVIATALAYPAVPEKGRENGLSRMVREASADPGFKKHFGHGGYGHSGYGGHGGYGHSGYGGHGGYGHSGHGGYGGYGHSGHGGYGGYPHHGGGGNSFAQSSANSGSFSSPFGSASFANAQSNAGSGFHG